MNDLDLAITLLRVAECPNCDGSGSIIVDDVGIEAGCCGNVLPNGECCGNAIPIPVQIQELARCQWCDERSELLSKHEEELEV